MKEKITRKDGVVYERKKKQIMLNKTIQIRISDTSIKLLKEIAIKRNTTVSELIRETVERMIEENALRIKNN